MGALGTRTCILPSVRLSRELVASSSSSMRGFFRMARANATRCFSPAPQNHACLSKLTRDTLDPCLQASSQQICSHLQHFLSDSARSHPDVHTGAAISNRPQTFPCISKPVSTLTAAEAQATLSNNGVIALGEARCDALMYGGRLCRLVHLLICRARPPIPSHRPQKSQYLCRLQMS